MQTDVSRIWPFLIAALVVWIVYRRLRRNFGQQALRPASMGVRMALLLVIGCLLLPFALRSGTFLLAALAGAALGIALALWGAQRTQFLHIANQLYYVPHTYTGVLVSLLFLGRLVYRLFVVYGQTHAAQAAGSGFESQGLAPMSMVRSPLTLGLYFVLMSYYVCYYAIVLWKSKSAAREEAAPGSSLDQPK